MDGQVVVIRDDCIQIDEDEFKISEVERIPEKYRVNITQPQASKRPDTATSTEKGAATPRLKRIKIKMTKAGLTFSGPSAYMSHMHRCSFTFKKTPYSSVEQGYHHLHAQFEDDPEIAAKIMATYEPIEIKDISSALPKCDGWNRVAPRFMWVLNEAKYEQNPKLKRQLIETAPVLLTEASVDSKWGCSCPYDNDMYEQGQIPGSNLCGNQLTKYRDNLIADMGKISMT